MERDQDLIEAARKHPIQFQTPLQGKLILLTTLYTVISLTLSDFHFRNQNVLQGAIFFFWNQYSAIARKKSNTTAIIVRVKI